MSKEAMKLALEASKDLCAEFAIAKVQKILEEALAKQEQGEPVAWKLNVDVNNYQGQSEYRTVLAFRPDPAVIGNYEVNEVISAQPLYTTPQQRKPLTDLKESLVEALSIINHYGMHGWSKAAHDEGERIKKNARKALAAHGIKENT